MSFKQKFISAVTFVFAIVAFTTFVSAQDTTTQPQDSTTRQEKSERKFGKEGKRGGHRGGKMMRGFRELNLTDAQKEQIKSLMETNRTAHQGTHEEMRGLMMKKRDGVINAEEQARFVQLKSQMKASAEQTHNSILAILTPEQRTQFEQQKAQMKQRREERRKLRQNQPQPDTQNDN